MESRLKVLDKIKPAFESGNRPHDRHAAPVGGNNDIAGRSGDSVIHELHRGLQMLKMAVQGFHRVLRCTVKTPVADPDGYSVATRFQEIADPKYVHVAARAGEEIRHDNVDVQRV